MKEEEGRPLRGEEIAQTMTDMESEIIQLRKKFSKYLDHEDIIAVLNGALERQRLLWFANRIAKLVAGTLEDIKKAGGKDLPGQTTMPGS